MLPSKQNTRFYLGLNFSNLRQLLRAVRLGGTEMKRNGGLWEINTPGQGIFGSGPGARALAAA